MRLRSVPLAIALLSLPSIYAQAARSFEVASIKPHVWGGQGGVGVFVHGNTLSAEHSCLDELVSFAWNLRDFQLSGGPGWASHGLLSASTLYQVTAKAAGDPPPSIDQFRLMLQTLLAERFQLKVHHVEKNLPVFKLILAENGSRLKESAADTPFSLHVDASLNGGKLIRITATHAPIAKMLFQIGNHAGRPVFDETGLTGFYDCELEFAPDTAGVDPVGASIFSALQDQLGLKLQSGTAPFDTVVIDHAEKPAEN